MFKVDTYREEDSKMILQKVTLFWVFGVGVMHQANAGEHFGFMVEAGPFQMDWTFRYWNI